MNTVGLIILGTVGGALSALLGIGGAVIIIPALVLIFGFDQKTAQGTTLMLMLPPVGILAVLEYYKAGFINLRAGFILAVAFVIGSWIASKYAVKLDSELIQKIFAVFLILIGIKVFFK